MAYLEIKGRRGRGIAVKLVLLHAVLSIVGVAGSAQGEQRTNCCRLRHTQRYLVVRTSQHYPVTIKNQSNSIRVLYHAVHHKPRYGLAQPSVRPSVRPSRLSFCHVRAPDSITNSAENQTLVRMFTRAEITNTGGSRRGQSGHAPFQSFAVLNTATVLFETACEHDKNIKKHEIFQRKFCT